MGCYFCAHALNGPTGNYRYAWTNGIEIGDDSPWLFYQNNGQSFTLEVQVYDGRAGAGVLFPVTVSSNVTHCDSSRRPFTASQGAMQRDYLRIRRALLASLVAGGSLACKTEEMFGTCVVVATESLFAIREVKNAVTGAALPEVHIRDILQGGLPYPDLRILVHPSFVTGVTVEGATLRCTPVCRFGLDYGRWEMVFTQPGFRDTMVVVEDAQYAKSRTENCVTYHSGPVELKIALRPL